MLTMQVMASKTWFWECNQIIQNDSVWGDYRYKLSTPICVETVEHGNSGALGIGIRLDASRAFKASSKSFYISQPHSFVETERCPQSQEKMDLHWWTLPFM